MWRLFPVKFSSHRCFVRCFSLMCFVVIWNMILWKGPKTPSQTTNHFWWVFTTLKIHIMDRVVFNDGPPFFVSHSFSLYLYLYASYQCKILSSSKRKCFFSLKKKIVSLEKYVPNLLFPRQNESQKTLKLIEMFEQAARQLLQVEHYEAVVEERSVEGLCGYPPCCQPALEVPERSLVKGSYCSIGAISELPPVDLWR